CVAQVASCCIADLQSANLSPSVRAAVVQRRADCKSAIQQITNLRYGKCCRAPQVRRDAVSSWIFASSRPSLRSESAVVVPLGRRSPQLPGGEADIAELH